MMTLYAPSAVMGYSASLPPNIQAALARPVAMDGVARDGTAKEATATIGPPPSTIQAERSATFMPPFIQNIIGPANELFEQRGVALRFEIRSDLNEWNVLLIDTESGAIVRQYSPWHLMRIPFSSSTGTKGLLLSSIV